jgi:hypothetical protein
MRKIIILFILTCLSGCEKDNQNIKFFHPEDIPLLDLASLPDFWSDISNLDTSYYMGAIFESDSGFLDGIRISGEEQGVCVSVFKTDTIAINAMERRIDDVACLFETGTTDEIETKWWFSDCIPNIISINQWNTIIEVYYYHNDFEAVRNILIDTGKEIAGRIDNLSK